MRRMLVTAIGTLLTLSLAGCATRSAPTTIDAWLERDAVRLVDGEPAALPQALLRARVVGLGEATHGQRESFAWKLALTMQLVRDHGVRVVAYEASASKAVACDDYIAGRSDDIDTAMKGLGMLIWQVEENARLLRELRAWNERAAEADRVRFIGVDVQDLAAAAARLRSALGPAHAELGARAVKVASAFEESVPKMMSGERGPYEAALGDVGEVLALVDAVASTGGTDAAEIALRRSEYLHAVNVPSSAGARDRGMAELLLAQLDGIGPDAKAVVWAHNLHVFRSPMLYVGTTEPALGGVLGAACGDRYYALGVFFGEGEFAALDRGENGWGFRTYAIDPPPESAFEAPFVHRRSGPLLVDLRTAPTAGPVRAWLDAEHGHRTFGGYNVPPDAREISREPDRLMPIVPARDYDGVLFLPTTTATNQVPPARARAGLAPEPLSSASTPARRKTRSGGTRTSR